MRKYTIGAVVCFTCLVCGACIRQATYPPITGETKDGVPYQLDDFLGEPAYSELNGRTFLIEVQFIRHVGDEDDAAIVCKPLPGSKHQGEVTFDVALGYGYYDPFYKLSGGERIVLQVRYRSDNLPRGFDECLYVRRGG